MKQLLLKPFGRLRPYTRKKLSVYLYFVPALGMLGFAVIYPWIWSFAISLCKWRISTGKPPSFIGLDNYLWVLKDAGFHLSLRNTLKFVLISVPLQFFFGLLVAVLLNRKLRARRFLMVGVLLPYMLTPTMVGLVWKMLLNNSWGVINYYLRVLGIGVPDWLGDPSVTMWTLGIIATWLHMPWCALMLFASLQAISEEMMEAARVDGANAWQCFYNVTLPSLKPVMLIVIAFRLVFSLREFDVIYSLFNAGGPGNSAMVLGVYLYNIFSKNWDIGRSSAVSFVMLVITLAISAGIFIRKDGKKHA